MFLFFQARLNLLIAFIKNFIQKNNAIVCYIIFIKQLTKLIVIYIYEHTF